MAVIEYTSNQITDLVAKFNPANTFNYEVDIHVGDRIIKPFNLEYMKLIAEYRQGVGEQIGVRLLLLTADYDRHIYPYRNNLYITIRKIPTSRLLGSTRTAEKIRSKRFKASISKPTDNSMQGLPSYDGAQSLVSVDFQLLDPALDQLRLITVGFNSNQQTPANVLKVGLGYFGKQLQLPADSSMLGVDMYPSDETKQLANILIPHGTKLIDLAKYIQKHGGGIYRYGIGAFYTNQIWYVYPLYDTGRYQKTTRTLDILMIPPNQRPGQDKTYAVNQNKVFIIVTRESTQLDNKDIDYQNSGNATQFTLASNQFDQYGKVDGNQTELDTSKVTAQFLVDHRESGLQATTFSSERTTDNVCYQMSQKTALQGQYVGLVWENGDPDLLYPGMPVRVVAPNDTGDKIYQGVLLTKEAHTNQLSPGVTGTTYATNIALTIFMDEIKKPKI